ncbi:MAG: acetolactate synthase small subunit [Myxococcales bacterium]|nr:acetolactate synthase small subunit [Myxococcales bacterium]
MSSDPNSTSNAAAKPADGLNDVHTLSLVVRDRPGVLVRIALVFARRGYNIGSLAVSPGAAGGFARMTITSQGNPETLEQIIKQLAKLVDVVHVADHLEHPPLEAEIALVKVGVGEGSDRNQALHEVAREFNAVVVDRGKATSVLRLIGSRDELQAALSALAPFQVQELVRSGSVVMDKGRSVLTDLLQKS